MGKLYGEEYIYSSSKNYFFAGNGSVCIIELKVGTCKRLLSVKCKRSCDKLWSRCYEGMTLRDIFPVDSSLRDEGVTVCIIGRFTRNVSLCLTSC